jgi:hypothetical protein
MRKTTVVALALASTLALFAGPTRAEDGETWIIVARVMKGTYSVGTLAYKPGTTFPSDEACDQFVKTDPAVRTDAMVLMKTTVERVGPAAAVVITCARTK